MIIETPQGKIKGCVLPVKSELSSTKCANFNNIPFAKTPRLERPSPYGSWEGEWDGTGYTTMVPNINDVINEVKDYEGLTAFCPDMAEYKKIPMADGELFLSVYTPEGFKPTDKKPVMVWIHGGGWYVGSASEYTGAPLAVAQDVVVVMISYRLHALGFLDANYGLWDQVEALKWVQGNIEAYGGDAKNVTIFGESAGGWSVEALLSCPKAAGLFHKAIAQSGCIKNTMIGNTVIRQGALQNAQDYFKVENMKDLRAAVKAASVEEMMKFYKQVPPHIVMGFTAQCDIDDFFEHQTPWKEHMHFANKVPFMTGMNSTELGFCILRGIAKITPPAGMYEGWTKENFIELYQLMAKMTGEDPANVPGWLEKMRKIYEAGPHGIQKDKFEYTQLHTLFQADMFFLGAFQRAEEICCDQPVYVYHLDAKTKAFYEEPYKNGAQNVRLPFARADHGDDICYALGFIFSATKQLHHGRYFSDDEKALAKRMMKVWGDFARNGKPGWAEFDLEGKSFMEFNTPADVIKSANDPYWESRIKLWRSVLYKK